jgi:hypothetical protein
MLDLTRGRWWLQILFASTEILVSIYQQMYLINIGPLHLPKLNCTALNCTALKVHFFLLAKLYHGVLNIKQKWV